MVSLTNSDHHCNTKQHYLTTLLNINYISIIIIERYFLILHSPLVISFNVLRNHGMLGLVQQVDSGPLQFCPSYSGSSG